MARQTELARLADRPPAIGASSISTPGWIWPFRSVPAAPAASLGELGVHLSAVESPVARTFASSDLEQVRQLRPRRSLAGTFADHFEAD